RAAKRDNLERRLRGLAAPTLLVWGAEGRIPPLDVGRRFQALIPHSRLVILPGCGHAPMLEHPRAFAGIVRRWLAAERLQAGAVVGAGGAGGSAPRGARRSDGWGSGARGGRGAPAAAPRG